MGCAYCITNTKPHENSYSDAGRLGIEGYLLSFAPCDNRQTKLSYRSDCAKPINAIRTNPLSVYLY